MGSTPVASGHKAGITGLALDGTTSETWQLGSANADRWRLSGATGAFGSFAIQNRRSAAWSDIWISIDFGSGVILNSFAGVTSLASKFDSGDTAQNVLTLTANKLTGTPGAGYGTSFTLQAESSTTEFASLARIASVWTVPTHAVRSSNIKLYVMEAGSEVEAASFSASGISTPAIALTGSQIANYVLAAPNGSAGAPSFRALVAGDIPTLTLSKISDAGTMAPQNANAVAITGGSVNGTTIGASTASTGAFTTLSASGDFGSTGARVPNGYFSSINVNGGVNTFIELAGNVNFRVGGSVVPLAMNTTGLEITVESQVYNKLKVGDLVFGGSPSLSLHAVTRTTSTNTVLNTLNIESKLTTGTAAAGHGTAMVYSGTSTTTSNTTMARIASLWNDATHASRKADLVLYASDASAERELWRGRANGSAAAIGFLGATPAIQQTGGAQTATGTWTATEQDMLQKAYNALRTFGLLS